MLMRSYKFYPLILIQIMQNYILKKESQDMTSINKESNITSFCKKNVFSN